MVHGWLHELPRQQLQIWALGAKGVSEGDTGGKATKRGWLRTHGEDEFSAVVLAAFLLGPIRKRLFGTVAAFVERRSNNCTAALLRHSIASVLKRRSEDDCQVRQKVWVYCGGGADGALPDGLTFVASTALLLLTQLELCQRLHHVPSLLERLLGVHQLLELLHVGILGLTWLQDEGARVRDLDWDEFRRNLRGRGMAGLPTRP